MSKIKVVIVDDSAFMRKAMQSMLAGDPEIEIVGTGNNGKDAIDLVERLKPDVMTLDIEMPIMDGLTALEKIMATSPLPIIMVSSLTQEGADTTLRALEAGAADFIPKEKSYGSVGIHRIAEELKQKVRRLGKDKTFVRRVKYAVARPATIKAPEMKLTMAAHTVSTSANKKIVVLGTSTGGPQSLQKVIPLLPANLGVPVLVVQHMPPNFTASLANRLNALSKVRVIEAQGGELLEPNTVYIAKGGTQMTVKRTPRGVVINNLPDDPSVLHNPSVDIMSNSVSEVYGRDVLGVIMTGMGNDGTKGLGTVKKNGGFVVSQNEETCIVYGMPRAVIEANLADEIVPLETIAERIAFHCKHG